MSFHEAVLAYRGAEASKCVRLLDALEEPKAAILRARAYHRLFDPLNGLASLSAIASDVTLADHLKAEYQIVLAALHIMSADIPSATEALKSARLLIDISSSHAAEAEYYVVLSILNYSEGNLDAADRAAQNALHANLTLEADTAPYFEALSTSKARALNLRGLVSAGRQSYHEQGRFLRLAILELKSQATPDTWMLANLLMHLTFYARDFDSSADVAIIEAGLVDARWPVELNRAKSEMHAGVGHSYALAGRTEDARRAFETAVALAPTPGWRIVAEAAFASFLRDVGERATALDSIQAALRLVPDADINEFTEERYALIDLAWVTATVDARVGRDLLDRYHELRQPLSPVFNTSTDKRSFAYEKRAEAAVLCAEGNDEAAIENYREAFEIWYEAGLEWLAAMVALELYRLTGEVRFRTVLRREVSVRPKSTTALNFSMFESAAQRV